MIKPRLGAKIEFNCWALFGAPPPKSQKFTGKLIGRMRSKEGIIYVVVRDYDRNIQTVPRGNLVGYAEV